MNTDFHHDRCSIGSLACFFNAKWLGFAFGILDFIILDFFITFAGEKACAIKKARLQ